MIVMNLLWIFVQKYRNFGPKEKYFKVKQQKDIYNALLTLQLTDVIYKDEWRDKWTVR